MKKLISIISLFVLCVFYSLHAQVAPSIEWQKSLGGSDYDIAYAIHQTVDSGFIVAGESFSNDSDVSGNHGQGDDWIVKLNPGGVIDWQKSLGGSLIDAAESVQQTIDGNYVIIGVSNSTNGDVSGNHGLDDYWLVKLDSAGNLIWQKCLGGSAGDYGMSVEQTADGGFIVGGSSFSNNGDVSGNHGGLDYWIVKLDADANITWQKSLGGSNTDEEYSVQQTHDGGYIVAGFSDSNNGNVTGNHGFYDYWIVKLDASGNLVWQKSFGGGFDDYATSVKENSSSQFVIAGYSVSSDGDVSKNYGDYDFWIIELDSIGNLLWQKNFGGSHDDEAYTIELTSDHGLIIGGYSNSNDSDVTINYGGYDYWMVKLDSTGNLQWQNSLGGSGDEMNQSDNSLLQTIDGGFVISGWSDSNDGDVSGNHGGNDF